MEQKWIRISVTGLILLFIGSIFWVNFHSALWYDMDMALNAREAKLMWEFKSLFPEGWVFGNQYQIVDTVNVAALFYGLVHQSTLAMSLSSSLGTLLILAAFAWCLSPFVGKRGLSIGMLCLVGGTIFGYSAASYTKGLQVLYTMGAYYGWYLIVLLLTVGAWLRMREGMKVHGIAWILLLVLNFGIGMNSLREALVLGTPLLLTSAALIIQGKKQKRPFLFASLVLVAELVGYLFMKSLNVPTQANVMDVYPDFRPISVFYNTSYAIKDLLRVSGIALYRDGAQFIPLSICAVLIAMTIVAAIIRIIKNKDFRPLSVSILFGTISIICVFAAGAFMIRTRAIYYFVYWLLAALSVAYLADTTRKSFIVPGIIAISLINFGYQFPVNFIEWSRYGDEMKSVTESLVADGYTTLYHDDCAIFAAASKDRIIAAPVRLDFSSEDTVPLAVFRYNKYLPDYEDLCFKKSVVCLSGYSAPLTGALNEEQQASFDSHLIPIRQLRFGDRTIDLFRPEGDASF